MFKLAITLFALVAVCTAEPLRARNRNGRFLARQEQAPAPAPTGYPASGVTPEVPFDLPTSTAKPDNTYLPPEQGIDAAPETVYGPPDNTYLPPDSAVDTDNIPEVPIPNETDTIPPAPAPVDEPIDAELPEDIESSGDADEANVRQQEDAAEDEEEVLVTLAEDGSVISVSTSLNANGEERPARLVYQRFPQARRRQPDSAPARLRQAVRFTPARYVLVRK